MCVLHFGHKTEFHKRNSDQKILPLGCNFKIFRMALTDTMTLLILVNFLTQFKLLIQQIFGATSDHRGNQHMRSGAKQFPTFNRICTRDECMNSHTKQFSFRLYLFFPPSFTFFLSLFLFLLSFLFLSFCFPSQALSIPSPLMLQCFSQARGILWSLGLEDY